MQLQMPYLVVHISEDGPEIILISFSEFAKHNLTCRAAAVGFKDRGEMGAALECLFVQIIRAFNFVQTCWFKNRFCFVQLKAVINKRLMSTD